jgi:uncharacterized membrane protein YdfJ with MMPL/SSD domain
MDKLRQAAFLSIGRAVGFSGLAIFTVMVGLSFEPLTAFTSGGILVLVVLAVLLLQLQRIPSTNYRTTETWLLLDQQDRPDERQAAQAIKEALREAYIWFARWTAAIAALFWTCAIALDWAGQGSRLDI